MEAERNEFLENATRSWWVFGGHVLISVGILVASMVIALAVSQGRSPDEARSIEEVIPAVKTETAILEENGVTFQVDGVVIPFREVAVASEVAGNITFLAPNCRTGRYVKKGEMLAKIDSRDYEHLLAEAEQNFIKAEREIEEWKVALVNNEERAKIAAEQFQTQERECERCKKLFQKGAVSQTELEAAVLSLLTKKEALVTLQNENRTLNAQKERLDANREAMHIAVEKAKLNLDRCTISAPLTGLVVTLSVEQDKFVQRGETLVSIHDTSRLEVQCSLYMKQVEWLWSEKKPEGENVANATALQHFYQFDDTPVKLQYSLNGTTYQWRGTLTYLDGPGLDSRTRMMPCRVVVENPLEVEMISETGKGDSSVSPTLMPGMFVMIEIHANPARKLLNLSETALLPGGTVWKVKKTEDGKYTLERAPKIMTAHYNTQTGRVLVYEKKGVLEAGEEVVVSPLASPVEGTFVRVLEKTETENKGE